MKRNPFRMRNIVGTALVLGILAGIWLGDLFKGFGWGPGDGTGASPGTSAETASSDTTQGAADLVGYHAEEPEEKSTKAPAHSGGVVKVLIDDRSYFVLRSGEQEPISLESLVSLIKQTKPDEDGLKAIIDRTPASRAAAEDQLDAALKAAGILPKAVYWRKP